jgi:adenylate kinase
MNVVLFGAPGSGKGTQTPDLVALTGAKVISLGDMLRAEVKAGSDLGKEVQGYMDKGLLAPDELVSRVIEENITDGFILDGFPRNVAQAKTLDEVLSKKSLSLDKCIYFSVDEKTVVERLSKRRICKKCGKLYHLVNMPSKVEGVCDVCGADLYQRKDDNPEVIKKRWEVFLQEGSKVVDYYKEQGKLLSVDARDDKDIVFERIKAQL